MPKACFDEAVPAVTRERELRTLAEEAKDA
jgi:hypothetical protein